MRIEEAIEECESCLRRIRQYDPEPFYVKYFLGQYVASAGRAIDGIFEEADRDFGLFVPGRISKEAFSEKAAAKGDPKAMEFSRWFGEAYERERQSPYRGFMAGVCDSGNLPGIRIMLRARERRRGDINSRISVPLSGEKFRFPDGLEAEIRRQMPVFLEVINHKRRQNNEPGVGEDGVVASAFADVDGREGPEIAYAVQAHIESTRRLAGESREKIKELARPGG